MRGQAIEYVGFVLGVSLCVARLAACTPQQASVAAEGSYGAELLRCVDRSTTLAESKACRATVDQRWGVTVTDAGGTR
jgi:hypothetical protein